MMDRLARETDEGKKIAVVLDNARFHHAQGPDRPIRPRSGSGAHHAHLHAPLRPRPWVPQNTYGTPPRTISPTPARSPRRTPSRPSPPTSPTAPSTTTSSTSQSHHHTPILFNSSHSHSSASPRRRRRSTVPDGLTGRNTGHGRSSSPGRSGRTGVRPSGTHIPNRNALRVIPMRRHRSRRTRDPLQS